MTIREQMIHDLLGTIDFLLLYSSLSGSTRYYLVDDKMIGVRVFIKDPRDVYVAPAIGGSVGMTVDEAITKVIDVVMDVLVGPFVDEKIETKMKSMDVHAIATSEVAAQMMDRIAILETRAGMLHSELKGLRDEMRSLLRSEETSGQ